MSGVPVVNGSIVGSSYVLDFSSVAKGTRNFSQYDSGSLSFAVQSRYGYGVLNNNYTINGTTTPTRYTNYTVYKYTEQLSFCLRTSGWFSSAVGNTISVRVWSTLGLMFRIEMAGWGAAQSWLDIFDSTGVSLYSYHPSSGPNVIYSNFTFSMLSNNSYRIQMDATSHWPAVNIARSWGNFGNISSVRFQANVGAGGSAWYKIYGDSFRITFGSTYPWEESGLLGIGSVIETTPSTTSYTVTTADPYLDLECQYITNSHVNISFFALQLVYNTDVTKYDAYLYIDGVNMGNFVNYYLFGSFFILKWDVLEADYGTDPVFEIKFVLKAAYASASIQWCYLNDDLDGSGDINHKYSLTADYVDGLYDGVNDMAYDLCYKIWFLIDIEKVLYFQFNDKDTGRPLKWFNFDDTAASSSSFGYLQGFIAVNNVSCTVTTVNNGFLAKVEGPFEEGDGFVLFHGGHYYYILGYVDPSTPKSWRANYSLDVRYGTIYNVLMSRSDDIEYEEWPTVWIDQYDTLYGNGSWVQFYARDIECRYREGDSPYIICNLSHADLINDSHYMQYEILRDGEVLFSGLVYVDDPWTRSSFQPEYSFPDPGSYYMRLYQYNDSNSSKGDLLSVSLMVNVCEKTTPGGTTPTSPVDYVPEEYRIYLAIGIIIGFTLLPFMVVFKIAASVKASKGIEIKVPGSVFMVSCGICGITGYILDIYWGLLEWWTVFVLIFVLALIVVIMYLMKKGAGE